MGGLQGLDQFGVGRLGVSSGYVVRSSQQVQRDLGVILLAQLQEGLERVGLQLGL
jgi:hypothetical protein